MPNHENREQQLLAGVLAGETRAGARLMRWLDDQSPLALGLVGELYRKSRGAKVIGITGNPGSGKSTLTSQLIRGYRERNQRVGVVCVDPSSPFSGGAILGDRIRMLQHSMDSGVFIRSLATRGAMGGLSRSTYDTVIVMDAMGFDPILVETVGVGQDEIDVMRLASTNVVVLVPGLGDDIQAIKAGILEIADIFVVNKADSPLVDRTVADLRALQGLAPEQSAWIPPIVRTVATKGAGVDELIANIDSHALFLLGNPDGVHRARRREKFILQSLVVEKLFELVKSRLTEGPRSQDMYDSLASRLSDPYTMADALMRDVLVHSAQGDSRSSHAEY
jgi:LAO/AO transport system kinase